VAHVSELEGEDGQGVLLERLGSGNHGPHPTLLLEARLDNIAFTARIMLDAARAIPALPRGVPGDSGRSHQAVKRIKPRLAVPGG
jgi:diaminopimelate dehydrogenase